MGHLEAENPLRAMSTLKLFLSLDLTWAVLFLIFNLLKLFSKKRFSCFKEKIA